MEGTRAALDARSDSVNGFLRDLSNLSNQSPGDVKADFLLNFNETKWREVVAEPENTLQIFITDKCNLRCPECFYGQWLGTNEMGLDEYRQHVLKYLPQVKKVTLLGGEPTLHKRLIEIVELNISLGLKTTIYTNGIKVDRLRSVMEDPAMAKMVSIRIGVHGLSSSEKPLNAVPKTDLPVTVVYMVAEYNKRDLMDTAYFAEQDFNCVGFFISSIREIEKTNDYWIDTERTVPINQYARIVESFVRNYGGNIKKLHLSTRGVIVTKNQNFSKVKRCRFGSVLRDGSKIISPFDISINRTTPELAFDQQLCLRHHKCVLQKIVLERR